MDRLNEILKELGISKVKLAKFLGVSRQMIYNYLELDNINKWPKDKKMKLFSLLDIKEAKEIYDIKGVDCVTPAALTGTVPTSVALPAMYFTMPPLPLCPVLPPVTTAWYPQSRLKRKSPAFAAVPAATHLRFSSPGIPEALMIPTGFCPISAFPMEMVPAFLRAAIR